MTTTRTSEGPALERSLPAAAAAAGTGGLVLMLIGTYVNTPFRGRFAAEWGLEGDLSELPVLVGFAAAGAVVVFGAVVRPGLRAPEPERRAMALAVVGALSLLVFWTGLPVVLAAGASVLALASRERSVRPPRSAAAVLALAALTALGAVVLAFSG